jgi:hypothetical protein
MNRKATTAVRQQPPDYRKRLTPYWCTECVRLVTMVPAEQAAKILRTDIKQVIEMIARRKLHAAQNSTGEIFVCFNSLE